MANVISFRKQVHSIYFDHDNFVNNYRNLPADKKQKVAMMLLGFYTRQIMEHGIDIETVKSIYGTLDEGYQDMLLNMINDQMVNKGENVCQN